MGMSDVMARKLHTIVFQDGDIFIASGVEADIFAQGKSRSEAERRLETVLCAEINEARASGRDFFDIGPAPESVQTLFRDASSKIIAQDERLVA
jgi:hypothetical protein